MSDELERQAAACLLAAFPGHRPPEWIEDWLERGLGGVVLFADNVSDRGQVARLVADLRGARSDLVVAIDEEGGDVTRLEAGEGSSYPGNLALGFVDDTELTRGVAAAIADELSAVGVTVNLAPVADVNSNPQNPVIGVRSFGSEPELVARHVAAFISGTQERGVAACVKHFPGHGDTVVDSHLELPVVDAGREEVIAGPLVPFQAAVGAGVRAVMTAHIVVRQVDAVPATLSDKLVTGVLRGELGFGGTVISDALEMRAISSTFGFEEGAVRALGAGVDALCLGHQIDDDLVRRVHRALVDAVRSGQLPGQRVAEASDAVMRLAYAPTSNGPVDRTVGADAARRAIRVQGNVALTGTPLVIELAPEPLVAAGPSAYGLGAAIRDRRPGSPVVELYDGTRDAGEVVRSAVGRPLVLVLRDAVRHRWQQSVASELVELRPDTVVVETGLPGWLPEHARASVETHGAGRVNLEAAVDLLLPQ